MWPVPFELWHRLAQVAAVVATGTAVRLMDDAVDGHGDCRDVGSGDDDNFAPAASRLGEGARTAYALFSLAVGVAFSPVWTVTLFLASYTLGMASDAGRRLPTLMPAWLEMAAALCLSLLAYGWRETVSSVLAIGSIQALDDLLDRDRDRLEGRYGNWALVLGVPAALSLFAGLTLLAAAVDVWKLAVVAGVGGLLIAFSWRWQRVQCKGR